MSKFPNIFGKLKCMLLYHESLSHVWKSTMIVPGKAMGHWPFGLCCWESCPFIWKKIIQFLIKWPLQTVIILKMVFLKIFSSKPNICIVKFPPHLKIEISSICLKSALMPTFPNIFQKYVSKVASMHAVVNKLKN